MAPADTETAILDAALAEVLAHGIRRTTASDIARRCGVARQTLYRYWPDAQSVFAALVTRELLAVVPRGGAAVGPGRVRRRAASTPRTGSARLPLVDRLRDTDPELFARYILDRLGTSQRAIHARARRAAIAAGQRAGFVRAGEPGALAAMVLLIAQSAVQSAPLVAEWLPAGSWRRELCRALARLPRGASADDARIVGRTPHPVGAGRRASLARTRRAAADPLIDVLVIGGGCTGAGIALDAASRGLRTVLVERRDLAHGTSRWSSKLVHGGLRYLASGQFAIAHESASERHLLLTRIAPHLVRAARPGAPLYAPGHMSRGAYVGARATDWATGCDAVVGTPGRRAARSGPDRTRPRCCASRRRSRRRRCAAACAAGTGSYRRRPARRGHRPDGGRVRGIRPHARRSRRGGRRRRAAARCAERARAAGARPRRAQRDGGVGGRARPGRAAAAQPRHAPRRRRGAAGRVGRVAHDPGARVGNRFVFTIPALHGATYIGITECRRTARCPRCPHATDAEIDMLLGTVNTVLAEPLTRADVIGTFAGLRPLLAGATEGETSDLSRRHAILESTDGLLSVVGGKLTTYRRMAQDAVDAAVARGRAGRGAGLAHPDPAARRRVAALRGSARSARRARFVRRYGAEAPFAAGLPDGPRRLAG